MIPADLHISLFMNLVELKKGEGIYVGADGPHAWLQGGKLVSNVPRRFSIVVNLSAR